MNINYKKSVLIFGLLIPLLFISALTVVVLMKASDIAKTYQAKDSVMKTNKMIKLQNQNLSKKAEEQKEMLLAWDAMLSSDSRRSFLEDWKKVSKQFNTKEFRQELPIWNNKSLGLGMSVSQPASQVTINFDASYRAMQIAMMEMETKLPQMQLDTMEIKPSENKGILSFKTTFTIWRKN